MYWFYLENGQLIWWLPKTRSIWTKHKPCGGQYGEFPPPCGQSWDQFMKTGKQKKEKKKNEQKVEKEHQCIAKKLADDAIAGVPSAVVK